MDQEQIIPNPEKSEDFVLESDMPVLPDPATETDVSPAEEISEVTEPLPEESQDITDILDDPELTMLLSDEDKTVRCNPAPENIDQTMVFSVPETVSEEPEAEISAEDIIAEFSEHPAEEIPAAPSMEDTVFFQPVTEETVPQKEAPNEPPAPEKVRIRKIRPAPKKGYGLLGIPHILSTLVWLGIILLIGLTLGRSLWSGITDLMAFGKPDQQVTITITDSEVLILPDGTKVVNIDAIAEKLENSGLISNRQWFILFASKLTDKANDIDPGTYVLNTKFDYNAMINNMQNLVGPREEVEVLIPEGYTCAQIFALLEEKNVCSAADMEAYLTEICNPGRDGAYAFSEYWFLEDTPRNGKYWLEGYLFPDTYRFYINDEPENVIEKFLDGFNFRFTDVMRGKLDTLEQRTGLDLSIHDIIIIASMIEKETAGSSDSYMISSVIYNRLSDKSHNWHLNIDATIYYALGGNIDPVTGLPKPLTQSDLAMDHPYNTYKYTGLPPGAISNPGRNSIDAALTPEQDGIAFYLYESGKVRAIEADTTREFRCLYYVYNPKEDVHIFSENESNHEKAIAYIKSLG